MLGIIGKKIGMTEVHDALGRVVPCTVVYGGPCVVTQIKDMDRDGYSAVQLGYEEKKSKHTSLAMQGHFKKAGVPFQRKVVELRNFEKDYYKELKLGQQIHMIDLFEEGEYVDVVGTTKGKGFQGVVKRHNFRGVGGSTHGQHNRLRAPGSLGGSSFPSRVFKGMRMAGRMGGVRVKVKNLQILKMLPEKHLILLKGAIPGANQSFVVLEK